MSILKLLLLTWRTDVVLRPISSSMTKVEYLYTPSRLQTQSLTSLCSIKQDFRHMFSVGFTRQHGMSWNCVWIWGGWRMWRCSAHSKCTQQWQRSNSSVLAPVQTKVTRKRIQLSEFAHVRRVRHCCTKLEAPLEPRRTPREITPK